MGQKSKGNTWRYLLTAAALAMAACTGDRPVAPEPGLLSTPPLIAAGTPFNSTGQCMQADVIEAGFVANDDGSCTSKDIAIAIADVSTYRFDTSNPPDGIPDGAPIVLPDGGQIQCNPGQIVYVVTSAQIENSANERYDVGLWIGINGVDAKTGIITPGGGTGQCNHYNLVPGEGGSVNLDAPADQCGDVASSQNVDVALGELAIICQDDPNITGQQVTISACAGWLNNADPGGGSPTLGDRTGVCPIPGVSPVSDGFRFGTTQETPSKCKCNPLTLPLDIRGTITIIKNTVGGNGTFAFTHNVGTAAMDPDVPSPFNITTVTGTGTQLFEKVAAGTYTVTESGPPAGWTFTSLSCSTGGAVSSQTATITLEAGGSVTCTYTNTKLGTITIVKNTVGGNGTFAFTHTVGTASDPDVTSPFNITTVSNTGQQQFLNVPAGTYTVTESAPPAGWQFTSLSCTAGGSNAGQVATIILPAGGSVTCTYTNTKQGTITIIKNTVGGNATFAFTHTVGTLSDPDVTSPFNITTVAGTGQQQFLNVSPGTYTVTESAPPAGWSFTSLSCSAGGSNAGQVATINLPAGGSVTCTYTNSNSGTITIIKNTVGGNGTFAFTHTVGTASDPDVTSPFNITTVAGTGQQQFLQVPAGTYTVTESGPPAGWVFTSLSCSAGGSNAAQVATIILPAGGSVTCTYTNTKLGTITIVKNTVGANGTFSFTHNVGTASDPDVTSPFDITTVANTGQQQFLNVPAGTYTVTESGPPAGWQFTSLSCTAGGSNAGQVATIILPAGGSVTCTYTNTKQGTITIIKNTVGGNGTFAFTHTVGTLSDPDVTSPFNITTAANTGQQQFLNVSPGTYTVTESGPPAGWVFTSLSCNAGGSNAGQVATINLPAGGSVTCTYTNSAQGTITIIKNTVGANGTFAFTHNIGSSTPAVASPFNITTVANTGQQQFLQVPAGTYTVTESGPPAGWVFTSLSCSAGGSNAGQVATINLTAGASVTCTYTNTKLGTITIIKNTVGGNATFAFTHNVGTLSDPDVTSPFNIITASNTGQQQFLNVPAGTYTVTESSPPAGWQFTSLSCSTGGSNAGQVATINLPAGGSVTCTYTNTQLGTITINKNTVGGNATFGFTHNVGTSTPAVASPFNIITAAGTGQQQFLQVPPGTYTVTESGPPAGWQFTSLSCSAGGSGAGQVATINLPAGGSVTCTYTNTKLASLTVAKVCVGGATGTFNYTWSALGVAQTAFFRDCGQSSVLVAPTTAFGAYSVTESSQLGWELTGLTCSNGGGNTTTSTVTRTASVGLDAGEDVVCTFTNTANEEDGRMTGGGGTIMVGNVRISQGLTIHCDIILSNNIEINWGKNNWHIEKPITSATCIDDPNLDQTPPAAPFDTFFGTATGTLNGVDGSFLRFTFVDAGEPGTADKVQLQIWLPGANPAVDAPFLNLPLTTLKNGNLQAHYDQPHKN